MAWPGLAWGAIIRVEDLVAAEGSDLMAAYNNHRPIYQKINSMKIKQSCQLLNQRNRKQNLPSKSVVSYTATYFLPPKSLTRIFTKSTRQQLAEKYCLNLVSYERPLLHICDRGPINARNGQQKLISIFFAFCEGTAAVSYTATHVPLQNHLLVFLENQLGNSFRKNTARISFLLKDRCCMFVNAALLTPAKQTTKTHLELFRILRRTAGSGLFYGGYKILSGAAIHGKSIFPPRRLRNYAPARNAANGSSLWRKSCNTAAGRGR
ncbi:hypothetical protein CDAR_256161 [Caerostris darwini]|uniref:Uncharacterized protein n=1 Tax=Caerostris darwini TaxID=1538125 RepID=A0AAV4QYG4_9ARAC|nr:hypothetical protein CDAR_256161 [Caerostris darwini]